MNDIRIGLKQKGRYLGNIAYILLWQIASSVFLSQGGEVGKIGLTTILAWFVVYSFELWFVTVCVV